MIDPVSSLLPVFTGNASSRPRDKALTATPKAVLRKRCAILNGLPVSWAHSTCEIALSFFLFENGDHHGSYKALPVYVKIQFGLRC